MNYSFYVRLGLVATLGAAVLLPAQGVSAALFDHQEVDQEKFIAVAVPRQNGHYNLLLLEQQSSRKQCWRESGSAPTMVDPLLLKFDFTGICGRSTDSNGYSIRQAGEDRGISHRLSVQKRGEELVLLGMPTGGQGQTMEIGRTKGLADGLLKIHLDPDWRLTKRQYQGKTLGHIYLTTDRTSFPQSTVASARSVRAFQGTSDATKPALRSKPRTVEIPVPPVSALKPAQSIDIPVPPPLSQTRTATPSAPNAVNIPVPPPITASSRVVFPPPKPRIPPLRSRPRRISGTVYRVLAQPRNSKERSVVRSLAPDSFRASYKGRSVTQVGLFRDRTTAVNLKNALEQRGVRVLFIRENRSGSQPAPARAYAPPQSPPAPPRPAPATRRPQRVALASGLLPVPRQAPLGNVRGNAKVFRFLPPPPPSNQIVATRSRFRVVVQPHSAAERRQIKQLVPDAFRSSYRGRTLLQVGSFTTLGEAQDRIRFLERYGFRPIMEKTQ